MSGGTDVSLATLGDIAERLERGVGQVDAGADGAPTAVDAGVMTGMVSSLLGLLTESGAGLSEGLAAAAQSVRDGAQDYGVVDDGSAASMQQLHGAM